MKVYVLKDPTGQIKGVYSKKETADLIQSRTKGLSVSETNLDEREGNFTNLESLYYVLIDKNGNCISVMDNGQGQKVSFCFAKAPICPIDHQGHRPRNI